MDAFSAVLKQILLEYILLKYYCKKRIKSGFFLFKLLKMVNYIVNSTY